ncbi:MAG: SurA N-terminal domain-containing protein, partial [Candidatus Omnitrophica bacterium]|nr:SurA N-terminal domain-containing protein [Candidatus Omnitrophota bacterium]
MVKSRNLWIFLLIPLILHSNLSADEKILAIVNNEVITSRDLEDFFNFIHLEESSNKDTVQLEAMRSQLLEKLIEDRLILQEARRQKLDVDKNLLQRKMNEIKKRYPEEKEFQRALNIQGLTLADIENKIKEQLLIYNAIEKNIKSKIVVYPQEVTAYYQANPNQFMEPEKREFTVAVFTDQAQAEQVWRLLKESNLEELRRDFSFEIKELNAVMKGQLKEKFDEVVFSLK